MTELPKAFLERMKAQLGEEYEAFLDSYEDVPRKGVRANTLKIERDSLLERLPEDFRAEEVLWCKDGLTIDSEARPGKRPEYYTGLYYPQEPSAMSSAEALEIEEGDLVLDLCAAPGGKSTQLAAKLEGSGTLVLNEIVKGRLGALASNIERMGIKNAIILNENPSRIAKAFPERFDKVLVDAPCSGEGMFRKDTDVIEEWSPERVLSCSKTQKNILKTVDKLLRPGGELVYSTCTFSKEENEEVIEDLLSSGNYEILELDLNGIESRGRVEFTKEGIEDIKRSVRIWPHLNDGEGHFVARLKKRGEKEERARRVKTKNRKNQNLKPASKKRLKDFFAFAREYLVGFEIPRDRLYTYQDKLFMIPPDVSVEELTNLHVKTPGLLLGELKKNRFEPSQALAMALDREQFKNVYNLDEEELWSYLKGEEISPENSPEAGWVLMCYEGFPVGFAKMSTALKNKYPKGLRIYKK